MDEVKARVTVEDGASQPLVEAAQAASGFGQSLGETAAQVEAAAEKLRLHQQELTATRARLRELIEVERQYQALPEEAQNSPEALAAWQVRQQQIQALARTLAESNKVEQQTAQVIRDAAPEQQQAQQRTESRSVRLSSLRQRLIDLALEEQRYQKALVGGQEPDEQAAQRARVRVAQIERLRRVLSEQADAERAAADVVRLGGRVTLPGVEPIQRTTRAIEEQQTVAQRTGAAVEAMVGRWLGFTAIVGAVSAGLRAISEEANRTAEATLRSAQAARGLATNVGGREATQVMAEANRVASEVQMSPDERAQLLQSYQAMTDLGPVAPDQRRATLLRLARLQQATGVGGGDAARLLQAARTSLNVSDDEAANVATTLLNNGLDPSTARQLLQRAGNAGGMEFVGALVGARETGLDLRDSGRSVLGLIDSLTRRDERGRLDRNLRRAGVTDAMDLTQRLQTLVQARDEGRLTPQQFESMLGGADQARIIAPLQRAFRSGAAQRGIDDLRDSDAVTRSIVEQLRIPEVRFARDLNQQRMMQEIIRERSDLRDFALGQAATETERTRSPLVRGLFSIPILGDIVDYLSSVTNASFLRRQRGASTSLTMDPGAAKDAQARESLTITPPIATQSSGGVRTPAPVAGDEQVMQVAPGSSTGESTPRVVEQHYDHRTTINIGTVISNGSNDPLRVVRPAEALR